MFDAESEEFFNLEGGTFRFEHTLRAISLWESEYKKPFMTSHLDAKELKSYFVYMCLDRGITPAHINGGVYTTLTEYIGDPMTATKVGGGDKGVASNSVITSEVIYSMMVAAGVPFEAQDWNLNRLLILLEVISIQNKPKEKMTTEEVYKQNRDLNAERKKKLKTKG